MMYGNSSMGFSYSPDNRYVADPTNVRSQFLYADGSRQTGFFHSPKDSKSKGKGEWVQSGGGGWYKA
jgi:hypothetical protein